MKGPVFSMAKIIGGEMALSPEMKSTGEVMGIDHTYPAALRKALIAARLAYPRATASAFVSMADRDKDEALPILQRLGAMGYTFSPPSGTAGLLAQQRTRGRWRAAHQPGRLTDPSPDSLAHGAARHQHNHWRHWPGARWHRDSGRLPHPSRGRRDRHPLPDIARHCARGRRVAARRQRLQRAAGGGVSPGSLGESVIREVQSILPILAGTQAIKEG